MTSDVRTGLLQTFEFPSDDSILIRDELHGTRLVSEPVLVELLRSSTLARLADVCQHGVTGLLGVTPNVTRLEHSVGALLVVRSAGAALDEQVAALLHDASHTVLSHVVDWALSAPGESFHEVHKHRFIATTDLPRILARHGFADLRPLHEELFPLVEAPAPHLCADRLDYAVRDAVAFGKLPRQDARRVLASVEAHPDASGPGRMLVQRDRELALALSRAYLACDRDVWSNPAHVSMARRAGELIGDMVRGGRIKEEILWTSSDKAFWECLRAAADAQGLEVIEGLERELLPEAEKLALPKATKVRTLNPDVCASNTEQPTPLSEVSPEWAEERQAYMLARQAIMN